MTRPTTVVEIAFDAGLADTSPTWIDVTAYVRHSSGISIDRGRSNEGEQCEPNRLSLTLANDNGRFTPGNTASPYYPNVKKARRIRVRSTHNAVTYDRFNGFIDDWAVTWPGKVSTFSDCQVTATSRSARLGRSVALRSIATEEYLLSAPLAYYPLSEPSFSLSARDQSGNNQPPLTQVADGTAVTFGAEGPGTNGTTAATFAGGKGLVASLPFTAAPSAVWIECFAKIPSAPGTAYYLVSTPGGLGTSNIHNVSIAVLSSGLVRGLVAAGGTGILLDSVETVDDGEWHHFALTAKSGASVLYVDGVAVDSDASALTLDSFGPSFTVGTQASSAGDATLVGSVAHAACGITDLSAAHVAAHADLDSVGIGGDTAAARLERYAEYAGVPASETDFETGQVGQLAHIATTGVDALTCMRTVAETEGGVLFDAADGTLTFHDRAHRYGATTAFTVSYSSGEVADGMAPVLDDRQMVNDLTVTNADGVTARAFDQDSIDNYGAYRGSLELATSNVDEPKHRAGWEVGRYAEPLTRIDGLDVNLSTANNALAAGVLAADVGTKFTLSGLPSNAPASSMDLFIEGVSETITADSHRVTLRTSPAHLFDVWILDDPTYSVLDSTTRLAY